MKKTFIIFLGLIWFLPCFVFASPGDPVPRDVILSFSTAGLPVQDRSIAPIDFSLPLLEGGGNQKLSDLKGKVVFLNFWATWCGPCRSEMPSMEILYKRLRDKGFEILAVNIAEETPEVSRFMKNNKLSFPTALDSGSVAGQYGIEAIPTSYIIDRQGGIVSRVVGSLNWNNPKIFAALEALLKN
jgi:thiol-disulfide isomerase/thioredoxin